MPPFKRVALCASTPPDTNILPAGIRLNVTAACSSIRPPFPSLRRESLATTISGITWIPSPSQRFVITVLIVGDDWLWEIGSATIYDAAKLKASPIATRYTLEVILWRYFIDEKIKNPKSYNNPSYETFHDYSLLIGFLASEFFFNKSGPVFKARLRLWGGGGERRGDPSPPGRF